MSQSESPNFKDNVEDSSLPIQGVRGTLFLLAVIRDEDDAATLRADLKRSRLSEYKLQRCTSIDDARNLLREGDYDLLFLDLDAFDSPENKIEALRIIGYEDPILGLTTRRAMKRSEFVRPNGIEDIVCKDDLSPSLVESAIRATIARRSRPKGLCSSRVYISRWKLAKWARGRTTRSETRSSWIQSPWQCSNFHPVLQSARWTKS